MADQRASDADRERAAEQLRRAGGDGRLSVDELDERVQAAFESRTRADLDRLLADVSEPHELTRPAAPASGLTVRPGDGGARWVVSLMSGATRVGHWRVAEHCRVVNVMGGSDLDLTEAELAGEEVTVTVFSLMGGADIYVPEDVRVEITDVAFMGGNEVERGPAVPGSGPLIRLRLVSVMGGTNVRRGPRATWKERRRERRRLEKNGR